MARTEGLAEPAGLDRVMPAGCRSTYRRAMMSPSDDSTSAQTRLTGAGLWLLPVYALLLTLSTVSHQPDSEAAFGDWSRYVTTDVFLASHMVGSILGAGLGLVGLVAALLLLVRGPAATTAMIGIAMTLVGSTLLTALFGVAAFAQPAIGRAHLDGGQGMQALYNDDVNGVPLFATFGVGALLFIAGALLFGRAVARTSPDLRWPGYAYGIGLTLFVISGPPGLILQPVGGAIATAAAVMIALRLPQADATARAPRRLRPAPATDA